MLSGGTGHGLVRSRYMADRQSTSVPAPTFTFTGLAEPATARRNRRDSIGARSAVSVSLTRRRTVSATSACTKSLPSWGRTAEDVHGPAGVTPLRRVQRAAGIDHHRPRHRLPERGRVDGLVFGPL